MENTRANLQYLDWHSPNSILVNDPVLTEKISSEAFNYRAENGKSAAYRMAMTDSHILFYKYPSLCQKITAETLNHIVSSGPTEDCSVLFWLAQNRGDLFLKYPFLCEMADEKTLNHIVKSGKFQGCSAFYNFCAFEKGEGVLLQNPELVSKVNENTLNQIIPDGNSKDEFIVYYLTSEEGQAILLKHPSLRKKISAQTINHVLTTDGEFKGDSYAMVLSRVTNSRSLILDTELRDKVDPKLVAKLQKEREKVKPASKDRMFSRGEKRKRDEKDPELEHKGEWRISIKMLDRNCNKYKEILCKATEALNKKN